VSGVVVGIRRSGSPAVRALHNAEKSPNNPKFIGYATANLVEAVPMDSPEISRLRAAIVRDPGNAELRYLLGAELAERREYPEAVLQMRSALDIDPKLHFARLQLGLLYLTMSQPTNSLEIWKPLEDLDENAALKAFKRGLEALIRDDFGACIGFLQQGISLNKQNATLNDDMSQLIDRVRDGTVIAAPIPGNLTPDFVKYGEPSGTKH
jgi:tetratricopeptide (TPR) repeat protein